MAALTASQTLKESGGSVSRYIIQFTSVNNADTYTAAFGGACVDYFAVSHSAPITKTDSGMNVVYDGTSVFTFYVGNGGQSATLFAYVKN